MHVNRVVGCGGFPCDDVRHDCYVVPDIDIEPIYAGNYNQTMQKVQTAVMGGNPPDVAVVEISELYSLLAMDAIIPLDKYINKEGGKEFLNIGAAGGLKDFGIFLCEKAIRDEGTSSHYLPHKKFAYPNKELTRRLEKYLSRNNIEFKKGAS